MIVMPWLMLKVGLVKAQNLEGVEVMERWWQVEDLVHAGVSSFPLPLL
jgi:hypothetical protein